MELKTILAIIYANGYENIITRAIAIDNNVGPNTKLKEVLVEVDKSKLPAGKQFIKGESSARIKCPVIGYNQFKLENPLLVQLPNGETKWTSSYYNDYSMSEVIDIPVKEGHPINA